ncbi:hypothetical protein RI129_002920 [Pyrocoelia pectoralis]|uniref:Reverse transcriptase domain-containing protein n=1 Tax=Pyrocoelia pectoralis TaxID=417401 RepID=A0AAN7VPN2_9COLE
MALLKLSTQQNFFKFNHNYYSQREGLAMGSNLSPILAEIFMNKLETAFITQSQFYLDHVIVWKRHVDDIICIHTADDHQLTLFLDFLNQIHPTIKFTVELENNNQLPFLDILLHRIDDKIEFSIYRKPSTTDSLIPIDSEHPFTHKLAGLNSLLRRLVSIPMSPNNFENEYNLIKQIGLNNGYPTHIIDNLFHKIKRSFNPTLLTPQRTSQFESIYRSLTFYPYISHTVKNIFKRYNITISFCNNDTLLTSLVNNKDKINKLDRSGVYQLQCPSCPAHYIGQTGRSFNTRFKEHMNSIKTNNLDHKSAFGEHILSTGHSFNPNLDFNILHYGKKGHLLNILENLEIAKHKNDNNLVNEIIDPHTNYISSICI